MSEHTGSRVPSVELEPLVDGRRRTAHELVRDALRSAILTGRLPGGTRLVQTDIAAQLQVSTTPVREAMRDLATEGLIQLNAHRGGTVYQLDQGEVREIYDLRRILEAEAVRRTTRRMTTEDLARFREIIERMEAEDDPFTWAGYNTEFHHTVIRASRSPRLVSLVEALRASAAPYVAVALRTRNRPLEEHNLQHRQMLECFEAGDAEGAGRIAVEHLDATLQQYELVAAESSPR